jgi:hypothetical protein
VDAPSWLHHISKDAENHGVEDQLLRWAKSKKI